MANIRQIKRRIKSAQNIAQITRAMEMVAASKMKKAQDEAVQGKPYAEKIYQVVAELSENVDKERHPLLSVGNPQGKFLIILISTNKGLCGGLNTNLFRQVANWFTTTDSTDFITVGKKGISFVVRNRYNLVADFSEKTPFIENVAPISKLIVDGFTKSIYSQVYLAYNTFLTALKQQPTKKLLLPITELKAERIVEKKMGEFLFEPSIDDILANLLPHFLENQVRSAILEAEASEHSARMMAMKNATDAASDLTYELTLLFNKARQEKITYEIADMVTARMAVI